MAQWPCIQNIGCGGAGYKRNVRRWLRHKENFVWLHQNVLHMLHPVASKTTSRTHILNVFNSKMGDPKHICQKRKTKVFKHVNTHTSNPQKTRTSMYTTRIKISIQRYLHMHIPLTKEDWDVKFFSALRAKTHTRSSVREPTWWPALV